ncbi:MAG: hypothetical protein ACFNVQ_07985 [Campylobacter sp.]
MNFIVTRDFGAVVKFYHGLKFCMAPLAVLRHWNFIVAWDFAVAQNSASRQNFKFAVAQITRVKQRASL